MDRKKVKLYPLNRVEGDLEVFVEIENNQALIYEKKVGLNGHVGSLQDMIYAYQDPAASPTRKKCNRRGGGISGPGGADYGWGAA